MTETTTPTKAVKAEILASDGRNIDAFEDLEARRTDLAKTYGKRQFSRAVVGATMGVPGPTVMRIERVTAKTNAQELEHLELTLNAMESAAAAAAQAAVDAGEESDTDDDAEGDDGE